MDSILLHGIVALYMDRSNFKQNSLTTGRHKNTVNNKKPASVTEYNCSEKDAIIRVSSRKPLSPKAFSNGKLVL